MSSKIIIKSEKSKIPLNFQSFLSESANKTRLIEIMFEVIKKNKVKVFNLIRCEKLFLSVEGSCQLVTRSSIHDCEGLRTNQEEADTRLILHAQHAISFQTLLLLDHLLEILILSYSQCFYCSTPKKNFS